MMRAEGLPLWIMLATAAASTPSTGYGKPAPEESQEPQQVTRVVPASEAIHGADIPTIDLYTMSSGEYEQVIPERARCTFAYTSASEPVLAAAINEPGHAEGVIKIHGKLVRVSATEAKTFEALAEGTTFTADGIRVQVTPDPISGEPGDVRREADAVLELDEGLKVGYRGWYTCGDDREAGTDRQRAKT